MNIDHVTEEFKSPSTWKEFFSRVFTRQNELMQKYESIEKSNGALVPPQPWELDDKFVQYRLKDMFWRFIEELCEAMEVRDSVCVREIGPAVFWEDNWDDSPDARHFLEELSDALHFLTEASIIGGLSIERISRMFTMNIPELTEDNSGMSKYSEQTLVADIAEVIFEIGLAANLLKNKPWKCTHMPTDKERFKAHMEQTWLNFMRVWRGLGCSREFVFTIYMKKSEVNKWRQKTHY